jgi:predicted ATPase/class 3 adenylate cyclase
LIGGSIPVPTGIVTFLFTDIEGSTKLAQEYPDQWETLRARHNAVLQSAMDAYNGYVFQIIGDAYCVAFHSASEGLNAALRAQRLLQSEAWSPAPVHVRMGIHTGAAQLNPNSEQIRYLGYTTLVTTQRIMSAGHGRQVLISGATHDLVRDVLAADVELLDLGERRLKDLARLEHLYQLSAPGLAVTFPPLKTLEASRNNLPVQLTSFIGRENEIAEIKQELKIHHLVTLTGPGGTGKTRLSLQVAADLLDQFHHGVWFIELAPLTDPELIPPTILSAIGITDQPGKPLDVLREYLRQKKSLIVLDNCEHLLDASANAANAILSVAPDLRVLASSRESLGVPGEMSYPVPSLSLPDVKQLPVIEQLSQYEAVRLFIDRAALVVRRFSVDAGNAPFIAQICHRLDGIPLAIELAAARVQMLSVDQISAGLDDRFNLLTGGARTLLPRQQTLRALIDWSYDLLSEQERLFFCRLAVFAGGWTLEAAQAVCAGQNEILPYEVLELINQLVKKSLVLIVEGLQSGETRYRMLETIRQYARDRLLEAGGAEILRQRHLAYFVKLTARAEPELYRSNQVFWLNKLEEELDNLRMALEWALATDVEAGLRIAAGPIYRFWLFHSTSRELGNWLAQFLGRYDKLTPLHVRALAIQSQCVVNNEGNFAQAHRLAEKSLQMARGLSDRQSEAFSLSIMGGFTLLQGSVGEAIPILERSLALYRELGDKVGQASTIDWLSINNPDLERATAFAREGLALCRELGDLAGVASFLTTLGRLTYSQGDFSSPTPWLEEVLSLSRQLGDQVREDEALITYGALAYWQGDYPRARALYEEGISLGEKIGYHYQNLWAHVYMAYAVLRQGELWNARQLFEQGIRGMQKANLVIGLVFAVEGLASLHVTQGQAERAAQLFAWADAMRGKLGDPRPPVEQASVQRDLEVIHSRLDDSDFDRLSSKGRSMSVEQAVALALEV